MRAVRGTCCVLQRQRLHVEPVTCLRPGIDGVRRAASGVQQGCPQRSTTNLPRGLTGGCGTRTVPRRRGGAGVSGARRRALVHRRVGMRRPRLYADRLVGAGGGHLQCCVWTGDCGAGCPCERYQRGAGPGGSCCRGGHVFAGGLWRPWAVVTVCCPEHMGWHWILWSSSTWCWQTVHT